MRMIDADELLRRLNNAIEFGKKLDEPGQVSCMLSIRNDVENMAKDVVEPVLETTDDGVVVRVTGDKLDHVLSVSIYMKGADDDED